MVIYEAYVCSLQKVDCSSEVNEVASSEDLGKEGDDMTSFTLLLIMSGGYLISARLRSTVNISSSSTQGTYSVEERSTTT